METNTQAKAQSNSADDSMVVHQMNEVVEVTEEARDAWSTWADSRETGGTEMSGDYFPDIAAPPVDATAVRLGPASLSRLLAAVPSLQGVDMSKELVLQALQHHPNEGVRHAVYTAGLLRRRQGLLGALHLLQRLRAELAALQVLVHYTVLEGRFA